MGFQQPHWGGLGSHWLSLAKWCHCTSSSGAKSTRQDDRYCLQYRNRKEWDLLRMYPGHWHCWSPPQWPWVASSSSWSPWFSRSDPNDRVERFCGRGDGRFLPLLKGRMSFSKRSRSVERLWRQDRTQRRWMMKKAEESSNLFCRQWCHMTFKIVGKSEAVWGKADATIAFRVGHWGRCGRRIFPDKKHIRWQLKAAVQTRSAVSLALVSRSSKFQVLGRCLSCPFWCTLGASEDEKDQASPRLRGRAKCPVRQRRVVAAVTPLTASISASETRFSTIVRLPICWG